MPALTPVQEALKQAALALSAGDSLSNNDYSYAQDQYENLAPPAAILSILAQLEAAKAVPDVLFDGLAVYEEVRRKAGHMRTSPENVSDVLDAVVRLIRAAKAAPGEPGQ
jgi:hypothetical protein